MNRLRWSKQASDITLYQESEFIAVVEPDPPYFRYPPQNNNFFTSKFDPVYGRHSCPFCKSTVNEIDLGTKAWSRKMLPVLEYWEAIGKESNAFLYICPICTWWTVLQATTDWSNQGHAIGLDTIHWGTIKEFDLTEAEAPIKQLETYLAAKADLQSYASEGRLKEVIQSCFNEFFVCDIVQLDTARADAHRTFLINAEKPFMVRVNAGSAPAVQLVHNILGLMITEERLDGLLVSTEKRFVEPTTETGNLPVFVGNEIFLSLKNYDAILEVLEKTTPSAVNPWDLIW